MTNKPAEPSPEVAPMQEPACVVCGIAKSKAHSFCAASCGPEGFDEHVFRVPAVAPRETQTEPKDTCPMCEFEQKPCPGGAHAYALWEDGIRTVEDYAKMVADRVEDNAPCWRCGGVFGPCVCRPYVVEDNAPARVEPQDEDAEECARCGQPKGYHRQAGSLLFCPAIYPATQFTRPATQPAKHTDDRPASPWTIVDDWMQLFDSLRYAPPNDEPLDDYRQGWNNCLTVVLQKCRTREAEDVDGGSDGRPK